MLAQGVVMHRTGGSYPSKIQPRPIPWSPDGDNKHLSPIHGVLDNTLGPEWCFKGSLKCQPSKDNRKLSTCIFVYWHCKGHKKLSSKDQREAKKMPKVSHCSRIILTCSMTKPLLSGEPTEASPTTWPWLGAWATSTTEVYLISFCLNFCQHENTKETLAWGWEKSSTKAN